MKLYGYTGSSESLNELLARRMQEASDKRQAQANKLLEQKKSTATAAKAETTTSPNKPSSYEAFIERAKAKAASLKEDAMKARVGIDPYKKKQTGYFQIDEASKADPLMQKRVDALNSVMAYLDFARTLGKK